MCPTLSASRLIVVVSLAVVMLASVSEGSGQVAATCYDKYNGKTTRVAPEWARKIISCHKQNQYRCLPGYEIKTSKKTFFLSPKTEWLTKRISEGSLQCPPMISN